MNHTPAPWSLETVNTSVGICHKIGPFPWKDGKINHACIYVDYASNGPVESQLLANAHLIAAAPELLAALKDCRSGLIYIRETHGELYGVGFDRAIGAADAAIAKAEGKL